MEIKQVDLPTIEILEEELKRERYKRSFWKTLKSTLFSLLVVAAVAVLLSMLLLPIMRIQGESMSETLEDGDIVIALNNKKYRTGDVIGFYYNNSILIKLVIFTP